MRHYDWLFDKSTGKLAFVRSHCDDKDDKITGIQQVVKKVKNKFAKIGMS